MTNTENLKTGKSQKANELEIIWPDGSVFEDRDGKTIFPWRIARGIAGQIGGTVRKP